MEVDHHKAFHPCRLHVEEAEKSGLLSGCRGRRGGSGGGTGRLGVTLRRYIVILSDFLAFAFL